MKRLAAVLVVMLAACGGSDDPGTSATTVERDPYEVYLDLAPADAPDLSRDDALARATFGCEQEWPAGTTDRALADAYRPTGICD